MTHIIPHSLSILLALTLLSSEVTAFSSAVRPSATTSLATNEGQKKSLFRPWPEPVVECHGDYRDQLFLEHHIGGNLYSKQDELPRLPVPELEETISRFLRTALPLAESDDEIATLKAACKQFPQQSQFLQDRLLERKAEYSNSSWLQELWQKKAYFEYRDPVAVLVSYFLFVPDDDTLRGTNKGVHRAAAIINALAKARQQICSGEMMYETIPHNNAEDDILCSTGFKYLFHSCRIPHPKQDFYKIYDPSLHKHCIVASGGQFFSFDFCDDHGEPLELPILVKRLEKCVELAAEGNTKHYPEMGWLTSDNRDSWAKARQDLLRIGGTKIEEALSKMESGAFVIDLDDEVRSRKSRGSRHFSMLIDPSIFVFRNQDR
jgi:carnitine O-acetyltransferase